MADPLASSLRVMARHAIEDEEKPGTATIQVGAHAVLALVREVERKAAEGKLSPGQQAHLRSLRRLYGENGSGDAEDFDPTAKLAKIGGSLGKVNGVGS